MAEDRARDRGRRRSASSPTRSGSASIATSSALCERSRPRRVTSRSAIRTTAGIPTSWMSCCPRSGRTMCSPTATPGWWTPRHVVAETFWPRGAPRDDRLSELLFANAVSGASALFSRDVLRFIFRSRAARPTFPRPLDRAGQLRPRRNRSRRASALRLRPAPGRRARPRARNRAVRPPRERLRERAADLRRRRFHPDWRARTMDTWRAPSRRRRCCVCASPSGSAPPTDGTCG